MSDPLVMVERPLVKPLPAGVPIYGSGHGRMVWAADDAPVQQLFNDWVVYWIPQGEASWELKDGRTIHGVANGFAILPPLVAATLTAVRRPLVLWNCHVAFRTPATPVSAALRDDVLGPGESAPVPLAFSAADAPGVLRAYRDLTLISLEARKAPWQLERAVLALVSELAVFARSRSHAHGRLLQAGIQEDQRLVAMLRRIDEDPAHPWRVADLARALGVTTHRMHAMCRSSHGTSLKAYIVRARMNLAVRLLRQADNDAQLSLKQVSERCGFSSQHFFSRQFRSVFQVSPSAYRKGESLGERSAGGTDWGEPVLRLPASDWQRDWQIKQGSFTLEDGRMVAGDNEGNCLMTTRKMWGDTAIEFDGLIPEHLPPTDISVFWVRADDWDPLVEDPRLYLMQVGAFSAYSGILQGWWRHLAYSDFRPTPGVHHRVRAEIQGERLTLSVDGRRLCEYIDPSPLVGGYLCIYAYFPGVSFGDVRVYSLQTPVPATAVADHFLDRQRYAEAAEQYALLADMHGGSRIGQRATYRLGLSQSLAGDEAGAMATWQRLAGTTWEDLVALHDLDRLFARGSHDEVLAEIAERYRRASPDIRTRIIMRWATYIRALTAAAMTGRALETLVGYLDLRARLFADRATTDNAAGEALIALNRFDEVLERFPRQRDTCARALLYLGRYDDVLASYPDQTVSGINALTWSGRSVEIARRFPAFERSYDYKILRGDALGLLRVFPENPLGLMALGRLDEVLAATLPGNNHHDNAMILLGREHEIPAERARSLPCLMALGRAREAHDRFAGDFFSGMWPRHLVGLEDFIAGDTAQAFAHVALPPGWEFHQRRFLQTQFHLVHYLIVPFLRGLAGDADAFPRMCGLVLTERRWDYEQRPWHNAALVTGRIGDAEFLAQPHGLYAPAELLMCQAIMAERLGQRDAAASDYSAYLALPRYRRGQCFDPVPERFARWRCAVLSGGAAATRA